MSKSCIEYSIWSKLELFRKSVTNTIKSVAIEEYRKAYKFRFVIATWPKLLLIHRSIREHIAFFPFYRETCRAAERDDISFMGHISFTH